MKDQLEKYQLKTKPEKIYKLIGSNSGVSVLVMNVEKITDKYIWYFVSREITKRVNYGDLDKIYPSSDDSSRLLAFTLDKDLLSKLTNQMITTIKSKLAEEINKLKISLKDAESFNLDNLLMDINNNKYEYISIKFNPNERKILREMVQE